MNTVAKFEKVSFEQYAKDVEKADEIYENIQLPQRATKGSAGYDFYMPYDLTLVPGQTAKSLQAFELKSLMVGFYAYFKKRFRF